MTDYGRVEEEVPLSSWSGEASFRRSFAPGRAERVGKLEMDTGGDMGTLKLREWGEWAKCEVGKSTK